MSHTWILYERFTFLLGFFFHNVTGDERLMSKERQKKKFLALINLIKVKSSSSSLWNYDIQRYTCDCCWLLVNALSSGLTAFSFVFFYYFTLHYQYHNGTCGWLVRVNLDELIITNYERLFSCHNFTTNTTPSSNGGGCSSKLFRIFQREKKENFFPHLHPWTIQQWFYCTPKKKNLI